MLVVGIALGLTWSVVGARQSRGGVSKAEDGGDVEHMVPGDPWQFEKWPSHAQREYLNQLASYDPPFARLGASA